MDFTPIVVGLLAIYLIGAFIHSIARRQRAGINDLWGRIKIFGQGGVGVDWFLLTVCLMAAWPATLIWWLANGRPEPRIVFNEKALDRQRNSGSTSGNAS